MALMVVDHEIGDGTTSDATGVGGGNRIHASISADTKARIPAAAKPATAQREEHYQYPFLTVGEDKSEAEQPEQRKADAQNEAPTDTVGQLS